MATKIGEKDFIKYNRIKTIEGFDQIFLIEDEHNIIKATNKILKL